MHPQRFAITITCFKNPCDVLKFIILIDYNNPEHKKMNGEHQFYLSNEKNPKRRMSTDCNYSVLSTLLMRFLKDQGIYSESKILAKKNEIKEEKNYSIIFLRIAYFVNQRALGLQGNLFAVSRLFNWLTEEIDSCVNAKYKDNGEDFRKMARKRNRDLIRVMRKVFEEGDLSNEKEVAKMVIQIYEKKGKKFSKAHQKNALDLAHLIVGVTAEGDNFRGKHESEVRNQEDIPASNEDYSNEHLDTTRQDSSPANNIENEMELESLVDKQDLQNWQVPGWLDDFPMKQLDEDFLMKNERFMDLEQSVL